MKVALGVTGCIGAYKSAEIVRGLQREGVEVWVIMTRHAQEFIAPLTFEALSGHKVITDMFAPTKAETPLQAHLEIEHIALAQAIDLLIVAPATANVLGKFHHGIADDFLTTLYLATPAPCLLAPAMNVEMWNHPAVQANVQALKDRGVHFVEPGAGYLACGMEGQGRLADVETVVAAARRILGRRRALAGERVLITAGPTCEDIDPTRFISNRSSGKMGYTLAEEAVARGAQVTLISGPTSLAPPPLAQRIAVRSAEQMLRAVLDQLPENSILIKAAAVADFRPAQTRPQKIKKDLPFTEIRLEPTLDILREVMRVKRDQLVVGFAAETEAVMENARKKLLEKDLDLIVANDVSGTQSGFDSDNNAVILIDRAGEVDQVSRRSKREVAVCILDRIERLLQRRRSSAPQTV
ncbi:MAG: bifunctional phosphopantothenoylcysteine decarboxylase/phosphopantothenate--cysteine ligase CoaBC [Acidobacteria bacterium]|nr:bifunctional phosphopantothenoylcysteine decarboxylase/phosphopantothenate--cysteine ligase CoaBC [Acidobacteriota bacterium]